MYGIYANIWGILMVNVTIYSIHGSYGLYHTSKSFGSPPPRLKTPRPPNGSETLLTSPQRGGEDSKSRLGQKKLEKSPRNG